MKPAISIVVPFDVHERHRAQFSAAAQPLRRMLEAEFPDYEFSMEGSIEPASETKVVPLSSNGHDELLSSDRLDEIHRYAERLFQELDARP